MTDGVTRPGPEELTGLLDQAPVVPIVRRLLADSLTAVGLYRTLCAGRTGTFLLESAEHGRSWSRWSFVGVHCASVLTEHDGRAVWVGPPVPGADSSDPLEALRQADAALRSPRRDGLPPLTGGLVGYLGYDMVRRMERLPQRAVDDIGMPTLAMMLVTDLAVLDHSDGSVWLVANHVRGVTTPDGTDAETVHADAVVRLDAMEQRLVESVAAGVTRLVAGVAPTPISTMGPGRFGEAVETAKEHIRAGDAFQVVLSQRFEVDATGVDALDVYRVLRASNPSPYMYLLRFAGRESPFDVVGSSPEALVTVTDGRATMHPIAGSRPRGATPEADQALAADLLADPKERSEHVMLVDLGRNDLGRVCVPGSVEVVEFMQVERYSHIMHIVSTVVGQVADGASALDVLVATFPAGTLSGAPKPRAMEIIESLEPTRRALYGGVVGYLDPHGDLDTAIAIRTAVIHDGRAWVQAGAGIVADSDPATEHAETVTKAAAVLQALAVAKGLSTGTADGLDGG